MGLGAGFLGAIVGGMFGGPWGAIIGGTLGLLISGNKSSNTKENSNASNGTFEFAIWKSMFQCMGKIAKSDGRVSEDEAEYIHQLLHSMPLDSAARRLLISEFNAGRDSSKSFNELLVELSQLLKSCNSPELNLTIIRCFCTLVAVDRHVDARELEMLTAAGNALGCSEEVKRFFAGYDHRKRSTASSSSQYASNEAYDILGVSPDASDAEVKRAFRQKAKECHPDRAQAAGWSAVMIEEAKQKFQRLSAAYEVICNARGIK